MAKVMFASGSHSWANNLNDLRERWQIRREEPVEFVVPVGLFKEDLEKLSRDGLLKLLTDLIKLKNDGEKEMHKHRTVYRLEGVPLPPEQYRDLFSTINSIKVHIEETKNTISRKRRSEQVARDREFERKFVEVAKERLPKDLFMEMVNETNERLERIGQLTQTVEHIGEYKR